ncbi:MAG: 5-formyltetrahydrofolate cyclo-ligase [Pedobacter sp.]|nr:5-formyltetrahydrofolate cyclo-ligase [Pedobacter sp.]
MKKSQIRKFINEQRIQLSIPEVEGLSVKLLLQFKKLDFTAVDSLHIFLPIADKKEPDTFILIDWLLEHHPNIKIIVPKADFETSLMTHHVYPGREGLSSSLFNILEPMDSDLHNGHVDLVVIPMLAFDLKGYRVGYGKGFYDRFLKGIQTRKVGLCFYPPIETIEDVNEHDVRLDLCITPEQTYLFQ